MSEKDFQKLVENEVEAFVDHMTGPYSLEKRQTWVEARDECTEEFWDRVSGKESPE